MKRPFFVVPAPEFISYPRVWYAFVFVVLLELKRFGTHRVARALSAGPQAVMIATLTSMPERVMETLYVGSLEVLDGYQKS